MATKIPDFKWVSARPTRSCSHAATGPAGAIGVFAIVIWFEIDFHIFGFRENGDVAAEVWTRLWASVSGTRCTRCPPTFVLQVLGRPPFSFEARTSSLKPPSSEGLASRISNFQPFISGLISCTSGTGHRQKVRFFAPRSARISSTQRVRLASAPPIVISSNSCHSSSRVSRKHGQFGLVSSRSSGSPPSSISRACESASPLL